MKATILAYAAGIIDGEGTIALTRHGRTDRFRHPMVHVASTSPELLAFLKRHFGGCITNKKTYKAHHKPSFTWSLQNNAALEFLSLVYPHLVENKKRKRASLLLTEYKRLTRRNGKYTAAMENDKLDFETRFFA